MAHLGATGQFPLGKLHPDDEGELQLAITSDQGRVIIFFGKPVDWIGMDSEQAVGFAELIIEHARKAAP